jgi:hypothetical protein
MNHLDNYKIFENKTTKINDVEEYFYDFTDIGFNIKVSGPQRNTYYVQLISEEEVDKFHILELYETMLDRFSNEEIDHVELAFYEKGCRIMIDIKVGMEDLFREFTQAQKTTYDVISTLIGDDKLTLREIYDGVLVFNTQAPNDGGSLAAWIKIEKDGKMIFPILRGRKSLAYSDLPITEKDIKWLKDILADDLKNPNLRELHTTSQEDLREMYT